MWRQNITKACSVISVNRELESTNTLHIDSRRSSLKRLTGILITIAALVGAVFFVYNFINANAAAPVVSDISPDNGPIAGGTVLEIRGTGFVGEYEKVNGIIFDGSYKVETDIDQLDKDIVVLIEPDAWDSTTRYVFGARTAGSTQQTFALRRTANKTYYFDSSSAGSVASLNLSVAAASPQQDILEIRTNSSPRLLTINASTTSNANGSQPTAAANVIIGGIQDNTNYFKGVIRSVKMQRYDAQNKVHTIHELVPVRRIGTDVYGFVDSVTGEFYGGTDASGVSVDMAGEGKIIGEVSPDSPVYVTIDGKDCLDLMLFPDDNLITCHTPAGESLGFKDVVVGRGIDRENPDAEQLLTDAYEYALRTINLEPKFGPVTGAVDANDRLIIDGGVYTTTPEDYVAVDGLHFDGNSYFYTGFDQLGATKVSIKFMYSPLSTGTVYYGMFGSRGNASGTMSSYLLWQRNSTNGSGLRSDSGNNVNSIISNYATIGTTKRREIVRDNQSAYLYDENDALMASNGGSGGIHTTNSVEMLLGSFSTNGSPGLAAGYAAAFSSFNGWIYGAKICKDPAYISADTPRVIDNDSCGYVSGSGLTRVLVRDYIPAKKTSNGICGLYDAVSGDFFTNDSFGTLTCGDELSDEESDLVQPVKLKVMMVHKDSQGEVDWQAECTDARLENDRRISCLVPPSLNNERMVVNVEVTANDVLATPSTVLADVYTYGSIMAINGITPKRGPASGGTEVIIRGDNFFPTDDPLSYEHPQNPFDDVVVEIGGEPCVINPSYVNIDDVYTNNKIVCTTTINNSGIADIYVRTSSTEMDPDNPTEYLYDAWYLGSINPQDGSIESGFLYEGDLISISPNEGSTTGRTPVTISGAGFLTDVTTRVYFDSTPATNVVVTNNSTITALTPPHAPTDTPINVTVIQGDDYAASFSYNLNNSFTYVSEISTGVISPDRGYINGGDIVRINGTYDDNPAAVASTVVTFNGVPATINEVLTNYIEVVTPAAVNSIPGRVSVGVSQFGEDPTIMTNAFTYILPLTITSITPNVGPKAGGTEVIISGTSFIPIGSTAAANLANLVVYLGNTPCTVASAADYTNTSIKCTTGAHASGLVNVYVEADLLNPNLTDILADSYRYVELGLSLSSQNVDIGTITPTSPFNAKDSAILVTTDNPTGYTVNIKADDPNVTSNDQQLKCFTNPSFKFDSISSQGALANNTWGYNTNSTKPTAEANTWKPVTTSNAEFATKNQASGPLNNGQGADTYTVWFGAKVTATLPPCAYSTIVVFTAVARGV